MIVDNENTHYFVLTICCYYRGMFFELVIVFLTQILTTICGISEGNRSRMSIIIIILFLMKNFLLESVNQECQKAKWEDGKISHSITFSNFNFYIVFFLISTSIVVALHSAFFLFISRQEVLHLLLLLLVKFMEF